MNDTIEGHNREITVSPEQLSGWYKKLKRMENALIFIMKQKRAADKSCFVSEGHGSPRGTIAMLGCGLFMFGGIFFEEYTKISPLICLILGIMVYFLIIKFSKAPSNARDRILRILKDLKFPPESELATLTFPPDATAYIVAEKISAVIRTDMDFILRTLGFQLPPSK